VGQGTFLVADFRGGNMIVYSSHGEYITMTIIKRTLKNITFDKVIHDDHSKENAE